MFEDIRCWAIQRLWMQKQNGLSWDLDIGPSTIMEIEDLKELQRADIPLRCTICHQTGHNKATCPSKPTPAPSTIGPSQSTPASSTAGPSQSTPAPVKRTPVKKAPVKRSHMKKVPLNDAGRAGDFQIQIFQILYSYFYWIGRAPPDHPFAFYIRSASPHHNHYPSSKDFVESEKSKR
ncbi:unnamed protein product [Lactuca virosa]|uniref:Uncharacterized protein n=1 Tax=Lactuca virosa TaxID=75947 RepID=A0AAU9NND1_9ASTR|nr:unnamed protein product [Lactuca virosa]